jgi:phage terminase large subunit
VELSAPQDIFINKLNTKNFAYIGGFGSGKTFVGCLKILISISQFPLQRWGFWSTSYPAIRDVFYPTFEEAANMMGFDIVINKGDKEINVYRGKAWYGCVICRSMSDPGSIVGYKVAGGIVDELDTLKREKASEAWNKINARLRLVVKGLDTNWLGVTTTPEGFKFVHEKFASNPTKRYSMVQASTYENAKYLPDDYIDSLLETYPANLVEAYIKGEFVNLTSGSVYPQFDRVLNGSSRELRDGDAIHIGMDFNVGRMCSVTHVIDNNKPIAVDEITGGYDTPDMIRMISQRYWVERSQAEYIKTRQIYVYPDASGSNRKSQGASNSDVAQLERAGFSVYKNPANPAIKDRVSAMNAKFCNMKGERSYKINASTCPEYASKLEKQVYKNGEPEKDGTEDVNDAGGYFIAYKYPISKPVMNIPIAFAM